MCSSISSRLWGELFLLKPMSIPRSIVWSFGPPMRSVRNPSFGTFIVMCLHHVFDSDCLLLFKSFVVFIEWFWLIWIIRYFLRKLKKVKKSNGQMLAINEVLYLFDLPDSDRVFYIGSYLIGIDTISGIWKMWFIANCLMQSDSMKFYLRLIASCIIAVFNHLILLFWLILCFVKTVET